MVDYQPAPRPPTPEPADQPSGAGRRQTSAPPTPAVSRPTLRRMSLADRTAVAALGERDQVLGSVFDPRRGVWEVLVLSRPAARGGW